MFKFCVHGAGVQAVWSSEPQNADRSLRGAGRFGFIGGIQTAHGPVGILRGLIPVDALWLGGQSKNERWALTVLARFCSDDGEFIHSGEIAKGAVGRICPRIWR